MGKDINSSQSEFNSLNFIVFLWKRRIPILIITILAAISAIIFSGPKFITPLYESSVVLFPTSTNSISKSLLVQTTDKTQDIMQFGEQEQAEQLLQILHSNAIRSKIIEEFDLMNHYEIDSNSKYPKTELMQEFESNINFRRTENQAVEIKVRDRSNDTAALMANKISKLLDSVKTNMQKERAIKAFKIVESKYLDLKNQISELEDSLDVLRKKGVIDYESQSEMLTQQLAIEIAKNPDSRAVRALQERLDILAEYGGAYVSIRDGLEHSKKQLSEIRAKFEEAQVDAFKTMPQTFEVDKAFPAEKKSYPVRWLIVVVSTIGAFSLSVVLLVLISTLSKLDFNK